MSAPVSEDITVTDQMEDLEPPCDYVAHDRVGNGPAAWIVWARNPLPCGCPPTKRAAAICNPCYMYLLNWPGKVSCLTCPNRFRFSDGILRVEPLR